MHETRDVVIVGGGAAGCAAAYYLGKAGVQATLIERAGIGMQASGYSAGGVNPLQGLTEAMRPLGQEAFQLHLALWAELKQSTGRDCQARRISMIKVAFDAAELPALQAELNDFEATPGFSARWLDRAELHTLEPRLAPDVMRGIYLYGNGVVDSHLYTVLLAEAARHYGVTVRAGNVRGLQQAHGRVTGVELEDGVMPCGQVVLAMGPWAREAESWLGISIPVEPLKGEILRMQLPGPVLSHDFLSTDAELFSRSDGQVWVGGTLEWCGFDREPGAAARHTMLRRAVRLMPAMADATLVQQTACLRPVTPDWLPIVGQAPGWENVYLATGGEKKGILLSPALGKAIADLITTGRTALSITPCAPQRFASVTALTPR
jgi:glycine oxidase